MLYIAKLRRRSLRDSYLALDGMWSVWTVLWEEGFEVNLPASPLG
jgi:hypothetical protein